MRELASLVEYETARVELSDREARALAATRVVSVSPDVEPGWWQVAASEHVGTLVVDDLRLLIRPKIRPENLFLLLEVGLPESAWRREAFDYSTDVDLLPSVIAFLARTIETTLARGVLRSYREERESLVALRGRPDLATQIARGGVPSPIACRYEDYTPTPRIGTSKRRCGEPCGCQWSQLSTVAVCCNSWCRSRTWRTYSCSPTTSTGFRSLG